VIAARAQVASSQANLDKLRGDQRGGALDAAQAAVDQAQANLDKLHAGASASDLAVASAEVRSAEAAVKLAQVAVSESELRAPFAGTVATRTAEPGEVVAAGTAIVTMLDLSKVYLRGFVPEGDIGRVKVDQPARIYLDSNPNQPLDAYVSRIDPEATFTPENTYFRDERVKQVVGLKLQLKAGTGFAKPGMPADGEILVEGNEWPSRTRQK